MDDSQKNNPIPNWRGKDSRKNAIPPEDKPQVEEGNNKEDENSSNRKDSESGSDDKSIEPEERIEVEQETENIPLTEDEISGAFSLLIVNTVEKVKKSNWGAWFKRFTPKVICPYCFYDLFTAYIEHRRHISRKGPKGSIKRLECPNCSRKLPGDLETNTKVIALVGGANSGKSIYITSFLKNLLQKENVFSNQGVSGLILNEDGQEKFEDYHDLLYAQNQLLPGNVDGEAPTIFLVRMNIKQGRKQKSIFFTFQDTPGEEFYKIDKILERHPHIFNADGILLMADPININGLVEELFYDGSEKLDSIDTTKERGPLRSEEIVVENLAEIFREHRKVNKNNLVIPPIAVCISKFDLVEEIFVPSIIDEIGKKGNLDSYSEMLEKIDKHSELIDRDMEIYANSYRVSVTNNFAKYRFFPLSTIGYDPSGGFDKIEAKGIAQPIIWLLKMLHVLK